MSENRPHSIRRVPKIPQRLKLSENYSDMVISYGTDNLYPQEILQRLKRSGTTTNAVDKRYKFVKGEGFEDQFLATQTMSFKGHVGNQILAECAYQLSVFNGFALHFNFNLLGEWTSCTIVPFEWCRRGLGNELGKIAVFQDWAGEFYKPLNRSNVKFYNSYNPENVQNEIEQCGGIHNYTGQILYYVDGMDIYPTCSFDAIIEDVETDARIKNFAKNLIKNGFASPTIVEYPSKIEKGDEKNVMEQFELSMGDENAGNVMVIENPQASTNPIKIHTLQIGQNDGMYNGTRSLVKESIYNHYDIPSVLRGDEKSGLFNQDQMNDAYTYFNEITKDYRESIEEVFKYIMKDCAFLKVSTTRIKEKQFGGSALASISAAGTILDQEEERIKRESQANLRGSVGGVTGILQIQQSVSQGFTDYNAGVSILQEIFGFSEDVSKKILGSPAKIKENIANERLQNN
jgi:hypothetical protein